MRGGAGQAQAVRLHEAVGLHLPGTARDAVHGHEVAGGGVIPPDERQHYDDAAQREDAAGEPERPTLSPEQKRHLQVLAAEADTVVRRCPTLLEWLDGKARLGNPPLAANASEVALWRTGFEDCLTQIRLMADWEVDDG